MLVFRFGNHCIGGMDILYAIEQDIFRLFNNAISVGQKESPFIDRVITFHIQPWIAFGKTLLLCQQ